MAGVEVSEAFGDQATLLVAQPTDVIACDGDLLEDMGRILLSLLGEQPHFFDGGFEHLDHSER